jgi:hypothetical protein
MMLPAPLYSEEEEGLDLNAFNTLTRLARAPAASCTPPRRSRRPLGADEVLSQAREQHRSFFAAVQAPVQQQRTQFARDEKTVVIRSSTQPLLGKTIIPTCCTWLT